MAKNKFLKLSFNQILILFFMFLGVCVVIPAAFISSHDWFQGKATATLTSAITRTSTSTETPPIPTAISTSDTLTSTQIPVPTLDVSNWKLMYPTPLIDNRYDWRKSDSTEFLKWHTSIDNSIYNITFTALSDSTWNTLAPEEIGNFQDFYFGADIKLMEIRLGDVASLVFRRTDVNHYYAFGLTSNDLFQVKKYNSGSYPIVIPFTKSEHLQYGTYNTLAIIGIDSKFQFFINGYCVGKMSDSDFTSGNIGFHGELAKSGDVLKFEVRNAELRFPQKVSDDSCPDN